MSWEGKTEPVKDLGIQFSNPYTWRIISTSSGEYPYHYPCCPLCSALINNPVQHIQWHKNLLRGIDFDSHFMDEWLEAQKEKP